MRRLVSILFGIVVLLGLVVVAFAVWVRVAPVDAARWHVDPLTTDRATTPNTAFLGPAGEIAARVDGAAPIWAAEPEEVMSAFDAVALSQPRTALLAGSADASHATYMQRSALFGYPDFISVRALPAEGGATLAIYSRSRFGQSDLGVNAARLDAWLAELDLPRAD